jgi:RimJ/RimL family protein N-acetyltransferase
MSITRVRLVAADPRLLDAAIEDRSALARLLDCEIADGWDVFPEAVRRARALIADDPGSVRWGPRFIVLVAEPSVLAGWAEFKGPPREGLVEIRYAVAAALRGRGIATAAIRELVRDAFKDTEARAVVARTDPAPNPSACALVSAGFVHEGEFPDQEIGSAWRFRHQREPT